MTDADIFAIQFSSNPLLFMPRRLVDEIEPILNQKTRCDFDAGYQEGVGERECEIESLSDELDSAKASIFHIKRQVTCIHTALQDGKTETALEQLRELVTWMEDL